MYSGNIVEKDNNLKLEVSKSDGEKSHLEIEFLNKEGNMISPSLITTFESSTPEQIIASESDCSRIVPKNLKDEFCDYSNYVHDIRIKPDNFFASHLVRTSLHYDDAKNNFYYKVESKKDFKISNLIFLTAATGFLANLLFNKN